MVSVNHRVDGVGGSAWLWQRQGNPALLGLGEEAAGRHRG